jgi:hypothetical protein
VTFLQQVFDEIVKRNYDRRERLRPFAIHHFTAVRREGEQEFSALAFNRSRNEIKYDLRIAFPTSPRSAFGQIRVRAHKSFV